MRQKPLSRSKMFCRNRKSCANEWGLMRPFTLFAMLSIMCDKQFFLLSFLDLCDCGFDLTQQEGRKQNLPAVN
jgi:hypothetical protein